MIKQLLYVNNISVSFDGFKALDLQNFIVNESELRVIIGPNGAGKTTFMDVLCGKTKPDTGCAIFDGRHDLTQLSEAEIVNVGVGRKFQTPSVFASLSVYENFELAYKTNKSPWAALLNISRRKAKKRIYEVAEMVNLQDMLDQPSGYLSHGQKQWLEIAMVILQDPMLLLIDEPAAGLSDEETYKTGELFLELANHHTLIIIEHDMEFVRQIAQTVSVFVDGKLLTEGSVENVQKDPRVISSYLGIEYSKQLAKEVN